MIEIVDSKLTVQTPTFLIDHISMAGHGWPIRIRMGRKDSLPTTLRKGRVVPKESSLWILRQHDVARVTDPRAAGRLSMELKMYAGPFPQAFASLVTTLEK